jgi:DNA polymerase I
VVFTEAKKRYAGITTEGEMDIVGLEAARSDWSDIARRAQRSVLNDLLTGKGRDSARKTLDRIVSEVRSGNAPLKEFVLWKTVSKPLSEYTVRAPHVEAARALESKGWSIRPGDKVGYVMVRTPGRAKPQVVPYQFADAKTLDYEYYVKEQILPACERILEVVEER